MFKIKISDSYCEWEYELKGATDHLCIRDIYKAVCEGIGIEYKEDAGVLVKPFTVDEDA